MSDVDNGGALALSREFTQFGEQSGSSVTVNGTELFAWEVERDNAGRITSKAETLSGTSTLYEYAYDSLGRLTEVTANGEIKEEYAYGANGARSLETNAWRGIEDRSYSYYSERKNTALRRLCRWVPPLAVPSLCLRAAKCYTFWLSVICRGPPLAPGRGYQYQSERIRRNVALRRLSPPCHAFGVAICITQSTKISFSALSNTNTTPMAS